MNVVIVGGGASGVFAGITLKYNNPSINVTILEQNNKLMKKLLKTGSGKCNITNKNIDNSFYNDYSLIENNINKFNFEKIISQYGILLREGTEGRMYPYSLQARTVYDIFKDKLESLGVNYKLNYQVNIIEKQKDIFLINKEITADYIIMATGSKSQEVTNGYELVKNLGHKITPLQPGLVPLITYEKTSSYQNIRWKVNVTYKNIVKTGEVLFRDNGLSGIVIMDISNIVSKDDVIYLDLMPEYDYDDLKYMIKTYGKTYIENIFPKPLWDEIKKRSINNDYIKTIKSLKYTIKDKRDFTESQITLGGVITSEVCKTFASKIINNLYITGELLNVNGATGGYNLYFAWLSGYVSAMDILNKLKER